MNNLFKSRWLENTFFGLLIFGFAGCQLTVGEKEALEFAFQSYQVSGFDGPPARVEPACFNERFVQPDALVTKSIDLLFVTDTSGSLNAERAAVADGIDAFVGELPADVDYQVAVMLAHGSRSNHSGRLWSKAGHGPVLSSKNQTLASIRSELRYLLTNVSGDRHSDGGEAGLYSFSRSLDHGPLTSSRAHGFFREDAALAVVFVSDENDICAVYPEGVLPVYDPERLEPSAKARDCAGITPESVHAKVKELQGSRPYLFGAIVYNNHDTYPRVGENEYGYGYLDLISLTGGVSVDMAGSHYADGLANIGSLVSTKLSLVMDFSLARQEIDVDSIQVQVDGVSTEYTYTGGTNEVHLSASGVARSVIDISYCLAPVPDPEPTPSETPCSGPACGGGVIGI
jgi:hypothetical protein